jgi:hypothetical protein
MDLKALIAKMDRIESKQNLMEAGDPAAYAKAQELMARLEKAAKYTGTDEIVRSRMGLPPPLPPIEQWDGTMPKPTGKPDWVSRLTTGGQATTDQAAAAATNQGDASSFKFKQEKLKQLNDLVAKISAAPTAESIVFKSSIARNIVESFNYSLKESNIAEKVTLGTGPATTNPATGVTAGKYQSEVAEIKKIMAELNDMQDDPEVAKALQNAQAAIDKLAQTPAASTTPTATASSGTGFGDDDPSAFPSTPPAGTAAAPGAAPKPPAANAGNKVLNVQKQLVALGIDVGSTGADGKMGPATIAGIKAFEKMAGKPETGKITPEFEQLLAKGAQIKSQSDLVASLGAMEQILSKYKVESVTHISDLDFMTESELRSFVMTNIKLLSEAEQMEFMKIVLTEAPLALPGPGGGAMVPSQGGGAMTPSRPAGGGGLPYTPFRDVPSAKPGIGSRIGQFAKNVAMRLPGAGKAVAIAGAIGAGAYGAYQGIKKIFADPAVVQNLAMDPADKAEFDKHMAVIDKYAKDPEAAAALPADVQKRLTALAQRVQKIAGKVQAAPAPGAAPIAPK